MACRKRVRTSNLPIKLSICSVIKILTHSDSELSSSTEDSESDSELDETGTATLDCALAHVLNFITRKSNTEPDD